jgi:hypothetical protein
MRQVHSIDYETWLENMEETFMPILVTITIIGSFLTLFLK